jgi:Cellulase (glycosyl hydrolase family 5)
VIPAGVRPNPVDAGRPSAPVHRSPTRRPWRLAGGLAAAVLLLGAGGALLAPRLLHPQPAKICAGDALQTHALDGLATFADWLRRNDVPGYIGEVGWPAGADEQRWGALAGTWYRAADAIGLPVTAWAAASWPAGYPMAVYRRGSGSTSLNTAGPQSRVVGDHASTDRYRRGVVLAGGSFGAADSNPDFSSSRPGRYGYDYSYENTASYAYLAAQGVRLVRLTVSWERLQPVPGKALSPVELGRLRTALDRAAQAGIAVIIDLHNYGSFAAAGSTRPAKLVLGSPELPASRLADLWSRLAQATGDERALAGYDLLNEPITLSARGAEGARLWEQASQASVDAIRATGSTRTIAVTAYGQTAPAQIGEFHPRAWIDDPLHRTVYEAHAYFDDDSSGHYAAGYAAELARLPHIAAGHTCRVFRDLTPSTPTFAAS